MAVPVRQIGDAERRAVDRLLDAAPIEGAQVAERVTAGGGVSWWRSGARIYGYGPRHRLDALCWMGTNLIPVGAGPEAAAAFAELAAGAPRRCSSMVGPADAVLDMWSRLESVWGKARDVRGCQPLLLTDTPGPVPPDPAVRLVEPHELDLLFPAAVASTCPSASSEPCPCCSPGLRARPARPRPGHPYQRRAAAVGFPARHVGRCSDWLVCQVYPGTPVGFAGHTGPRSLRSGV